MPVLPFLEDSEENVLAVVRMAAKCGARFVYPSFGVTLRQNQRDYFLDALERRFPGQGLATRYIKQYGYQYYCGSPNEKRLWQVFRDECEKLGLLWKMEDIIRSYQMGYGGEQLSFFS